MDLSPNMRASDYVLPPLPTQAAKQVNSSLAMWSPVFNKVN